MRFYNTGKKKITLDKTTKLDNRTVNHLRVMHCALRRDEISKYDVENTSATPFVQIFTMGGHSDSNEMMKLKYPKQYPEENDLPCCLNKQRQEF